MIGLPRRAFPFLFLLLAPAAILGIASLLFDVQDFLKDWDKVSAYDYAAAKGRNEMPKWDIDRLTGEIRDLRRQAAELRDQADLLRGMGSGDMAAAKADWQAAWDKSWKRARERAEQGPDLRF